MENGNTAENENEFVTDEGEVIEGRVIQELDNNQGQEGDNGEEEMEDANVQDDDTGGVNDDDDDDDDDNDYDDVKLGSVFAFEGHTDAVLSVSWHPSNPFLVASGGMDDKAYIFSIDTQISSQPLELSGHTDTVSTVDFNYDGSLLATAGMDGQVLIWDSSSGNKLQSFEGSGSCCEWMQWHPRGNVVLMGSEDYLIWMWNADTGAFLNSFSGHRGPVRCGCFTPDGRHIVSGADQPDCTVKVWNPRTAECLQTLEGHPFHNAGLSSVAVNETGQLILSGSVDGQVRVSSLDSGRFIGSLTGHSGSVECFGFCGTPSVFVSGATDGKMLIFDQNNLQQRGNCQHPYTVTKIKSIGDGYQFVSSCLDGILRLWDIRTYSKIKEWGGHQDSIQDFVVNPQQSLVLTASDDSTVMLFTL